MSTLTAPSTSVRPLLVNRPGSGRLASTADRVHLALCASEPDEYPLEELQKVGQGFWDGKRACAITDLSSACLHCCAWVHSSTGLPHNPAPAGVRNYVARNNMREMKVSPHVWAHLKARCHAPQRKEKRELLRWRRGGEEERRRRGAESARVLV